MKKLIQRTAFWIAKIISIFITFLSTLLLLILMAAIVYEISIHTQHGFIEIPKTLGLTLLFSFEIICTLMLIGVLGLNATKIIGLR